MPVTQCKNGKWKIGSGGKLKRVGTKTIVKNETTEGKADESKH